MIWFGVWGLFVWCLVWVCAVAVCLVCCLGLFAGEVCCGVDCCWFCLVVWRGALWDLSLGVSVCFGIYLLGSGCCYNFVVCVLLFVCWVWVDVFC